MKWVPFLLNVVYKRVRGLNLGEGGGEAHRKAFCLVPPSLEPALFNFVSISLIFFKAVEPNVVHDVKTL